MIKRLGPSHEYDVLASLFYADTGYIAPGKDAPAAFGRDEDEIAAARALWPVWVRGDALSAALADIERLKTKLGDAVETAARFELQRDGMREALRRLADEPCEGSWTDEAGDGYLTCEEVDADPEETCTGCTARRALAGGRR